MKFLQKMAKAVVIMALMFASLAPSSTPIASAATSSVFVAAFGGEIVTYVPPTVICPVGHTVIFDYASNSTIGIATVFGTTVYDYGNLYTPSDFVLGSAVLTPIPCPLPYRIYPISEIGTSPF